MIQKTYKGKKSDQSVRVTVKEPGVATSSYSLLPRRDLYINISGKANFHWGCGTVITCHPTKRLAVSLLADATGDDKLATLAYERFEKDILVELSDDWTMTDNDIKATLERLLEY